MAYADPQSTSNPTTGQAILAAWGDIVRDDLEYVARNKPHCRVFNSAAISHATSGTPQALTFNSERYDVGSCHSTSSNTGRLTVPSGEGGKYNIWGCVEWAANATGIRYLYIRLNGTTIIAYTAALTLGAGSAHPQDVGGADYALAAGDYVELVANQTSGAALNVQATGNYSPEFSMRWVAV